MKFLKEEFINNFLSPISKIGDNAKLVCSKTDTYCIINTIDNTNILYARYLSGIDSDEQNVNIPDLKKFIRLVECVPVTGELELKKNVNRVSYKGTSFKFDYYLLDDAYIPRVPISKDKIEKLAFDTTFNLTSDKLLDVLKLSSITTDTEKMYIYTEDTAVKVDLDDKERQNITNVSVQVADKFEGSAITKPVPISLGNLRLIAFEKNEDVEISINTTLKIVLIKIVSEQVELKYIISGLVK